MAIALIAGLGNPGSNYQQHRHNVGFWFVEQLAQHHQGTFKNERKVFGEMASITLDTQTTRLIKPTTFMNHSGRSVQAAVNFFNIPIDEVLVVHDELDFAAGDIKLKKGGGHGGHNGLRDIISALGSADFYRLRIGIDHPGHSSLVSNYVLNNASKTEQLNIESAITKALTSITDIINGNMEQAMNQLHTKTN